MKAHSTAKPEHSRHHGSSNRSGHGHGQQATAAPDSRPEMEQQQGLLSLMAGSPRLQRKCACGAPSAAGGSCTACEAKANGAGSQVLQMKLAIGATDDPLEREADRVADQVMNMTPPAIANIQQQAEEEHKEVQAKPLVETITPIVQRQGTMADEDQVQAKCEVFEAEEQVQRSPNGVLQVQADFENRLNTSKGGGSPLPDEVRSFMEPRFGMDFSQVKVHTDSEAVQMNQQLNAQAFAHGRDVYFGSGKAPGRNKLTAHELTHLVQQSSSLETNQLRASNHPRIASIMRQPIIQPQTEEGMKSANSESLPAAWGKDQMFSPPISLPSIEAAHRVNQAIDLMGAGMTYVRRPPISPEAVATTDDSSPETFIQTSSDVSIRLSGNGSSRLEKVHGGVVGSIQVCWDCLTGDASLKGWIWAGVGYDLWGKWFGGYYFGEKTWWKGDLGKWFEPGNCDDTCDTNKDAKSESGFGVAGFPLDIKPKQRALFSKGGVEGGFLLTPHDFCDWDIELIALFNLLQYLGPIAAVATKSIDGLNAVTKNSPHVTLEAGIAISTTFHLCRGTNSLLALNRANFCGGGFIGAGFGLSHSKTENHGAT